MHTSRLRGRKIGAIAKSPSRLYIRRFLSFVMVAVMTLLPVVLWFRALALNDYLGRVEEITHYEISQALNSTNESPRTLDRSAQSTASSLDRQSSGRSEAEIARARSQSNELPAVLHFPAYFDDGIEMLMEQDGLRGSKAINLLLDVNASLLYPNLVWIGSPIPRRLCNMRWVHQALEFYRAQNNKRRIKEDWDFHLLDWSDNNYEVIRCPELEKLVGREKIHYWKRSIVKGRYWNKTTKTIIPGSITTQLAGVKVRPLYLATRTDLVKGIEAAVASLTNRTTMTAKELTDYVVTKDRPGDVIHHWPARGGKVDRGVPTKPNERLRSKTSVTLNQMKRKYSHLSDVFCGIYGVAMNAGRESTSSPFVESLLRYKIMVVTQRDFFEGHLRLFEGLVSGSLVIHDRILALPPGLEENKNIVFFDTQEELVEKVLYYLNHTDERMAIARRGRQLALCQSRTWHRMEQVILGKAVTPCDE